MHTDRSTLDVLDEMHDAILKADFAALKQLTPDLEASMAALQNTPNQKLFTQVKAKANRNAACLTAAVRGVRAAQNRLAELRDAAIGFATYDGRGKRAMHGAPSGFTRRF